MTQTRTAGHCAPDEVARMLREAAEYSEDPTEQAAIELLIQHDFWLRRYDFRELINLIDMDDQGGRIAEVRWRDVWTALNVTEVDETLRNVRAALPNANEPAYRKLRIAVSLAVGEMHDLLTVDDNQAATDLLVRTVAHALGNTAAVKGR
jgi:hypothetical protein